MVEARAYEIIDEMGQFDFEEFKRLWTGGFTGYESVKWWFDKKIRECWENDQVRSSIITGNAWKSISAWWGSEDIKFAELTPRKLEEYEKWMLTEGNRGRGKAGKIKPKPASINTCSMYLRSLRSIFNMAIHEGKLSPDVSPFNPRKFTIRSSQGRKRPLTLEEIGLIFDYRPEPMSWEDLTKDLFIFAYLGRGMNNGDIARLKYRNIEGHTLYYHRKKTSGTRQLKRELKVPLKPYMAAVIEKWGQKPKMPDKYIFDFLTHGASEEKNVADIAQLTKQLNKYLKRIAQAVGIDKPITTYYNRHTYASIMRRSGMSIDVLAEMLGHTSTKITRDYLSRFPDEEEEIRELEENLIPGRKKSA